MREIETKRDISVSARGDNATPRAAGGHQGPHTRARRRSEIRVGAKDEKDLSASLDATPFLPASLGNPGSKGGASGGSYPVRWTASLPETVASGIPRTMKASRRAVMARQAVAYLPQRNKSGRLPRRTIWGAPRLAEAYAPLDARGAIIHLIRTCY